MKIDIKRDRELLGIPSRRKYSPPRFLKLIFAALIVFLLSSVTGQFIGNLLKTQEQRNIVINLSNQSLHYNLDDTYKTLTDLKNQANSGNTNFQVLYANACAQVASIMPESNVWIEEGLVFINMAMDKINADDKMYTSALLLKSSLLYSSGNQTAAYHELRKLNTAKSFTEIANNNPNTIQGGLTYSNMLAYFLATSTDPDIKNPELALQIIKNVIIQPDGRNASTLDTLAEAYFANNLIDDAIRVQKHALAKADYPLLWDLTNNFSKFSNSK